MGHGKLVRLLSRGLLLVVTAMQGLTPDLNDLASPRALLLLCPSTADVNPLRVEDDSPDEVCEFMEPVQARGLFPKPDHHPSSGFKMPFASSHAGRSMAVGLTGNGGIVIRPLSLRCDLCRLLC